MSGKQCTPYQLLCSALSALGLHCLLSIAYPILRVIMVILQMPMQIPGVMHQLFLYFHTGKLKGKIYICKVNLSSHINPLMPSVP